MRMLNTPMEWTVRLHDGSTVSVRADAADGLAGADDRDYRFVNLMDIPAKDQAYFEIISRTPNDDERVVVTVALFPRSSVAAARRR